MRAVPRPLQGARCTLDCAASGVILNCVRGRATRLDARNRAHWVSVFFMNCDSDQLINRPIAAATSAMRHEKPHSLSYHASTRTVRRPTTLV